MFVIRTIKQVPKGFQPDYEDVGVPYLSQKTGGSYGVNGYVSKETEQYIELITNEMIVTGVDNVSKGVMYWWDEPFFGNKLTGIANNHLNRLTAQYIITVLLKMYMGYSYNNKISNKIIRETEIELPILSSEDTEPYWDYMAYYIHNIQQQYADQLEAKSEYELDLMCQILGVTREEIEQIVEFTQPQYTNKFTVGELFGVTGTKSTNAGTLDFKDCGVEFIGRTSVNNGVQGYIDELEYAPNEEGTITVSQVGTIVAQYRGEPYYTSQNIAKLEYNRKLSKEEGLYFVTRINKHLQLYGGYQTPKLDDIKNIILELPVLAPNTKQIDWGAIRNDIIWGETPIWLLVKRYATEILR